MNDSTALLYQYLLSRAIIPIHFLQQEKTLTQPAGWDGQQLSWLFHYSEIYGLTREIYHAD